MPAPPPDAAVVAAHNNADRVDEVARRAGCVTHRDGRRWWSASRTPPLHPDAVTLVAGLGADEVLAGTDASAGCSVKDSFAELDLTGRDFTVLLEGSWLRHRGLPSGAWRLGWRWAEVDGVEVATVDGSTVASCTSTLSATVVGVTNVDAPDLDPVAVWGELLAHLAELAPGRPVVAWEPADAVPAAVAAGFDVVGPMRVWVRP